MGPRRHDLADQEPEKLQELIQLWWAQAGQYGALPLENRGALEILTTDRPQLTKPRNRYVYYPGTAEVPESVAPNIRNRSYTVAVSPVVGLYAAPGALILYAAFGSSRHLVVGPMAATAALSAAAVGDVAAGQVGPVRGADGHPGPDDGHPGAGRRAGAARVPGQLYF